MFFPIVVKAIIPFVCSFFLTEFQDVFMDIENITMPSPAMWGLGIGKWVPLAEWDVEPVRTLRGLWRRRRAYSRTVGTVFTSTLDLNILLIISCAERPGKPLLAEMNCIYFGIVAGSMGAVP